MSENVFFKHKYSSMSIEYAMKNINTFEEFEKRFSDEMLDNDIQIADCISDLLIRHNKSAHSVSVLAGLSDSYVGNLQNGKTKNPSRETLIKICIAAGASFDELQELLKVSGNQPLYVRRKRDVIIWFGIEKGSSIEEINRVLYDRNLKTLTD